MSMMEAWDRLKASGYTPLEGSKFLYEFTLSYRGCEMSPEAREAFHRAEIDMKDIEPPDPFAWERGF